MRKIEFKLNLMLFDERGASRKCIEKCELRYVTNKIFNIQKGMRVLIGKNKNDLSVHTVEDVKWIVDNDRVLVELDDFPVIIESEETEEEASDAKRFYESVKRELVNYDGWHIIKWKEVKNNGFRIKLVKELSNDE